MCLKACASTRTGFICFKVGYVQEAGMHCITCATFGSSMPVLVPAPSKPFNELEKRFNMNLHNIA